MSNAKPLEIQVSTLISTKIETQFVSGNGITIFLASSQNRPSSSGSSCEQLRQTRRDKESNFSREEGKIFPRRKRAGMEFSLCDSVAPQNEEIVQGPDAI